MCQRLASGEPIIRVQVGGRPRMQGRGGDLHRGRGPEILLRAQCGQSVRGRPSCLCVHVGVLVCISPCPSTSRLDGPRKRELDAGQPAPPVNSDWFVEKWATQLILLLYFYRSCFECTPVTQRGVAGSACLLVLKSALQAAGYQGGCAGEHLVPRGATVWGGSGSAIL